MTITYNFSSDEDGWSLLNTTFESGQGNPPGCLKLTVLPGCETQSPAMSDEIVSDGSLKFHYRFIDCGDCNPLFDIVRIYASGGAEIDILPIEATADSGWQLYTFDMVAEFGAGSTISSVGFDTTGSSTPSGGYVLIDNVYLGTITGGPADPAGLNYGLTHSAAGIPGSVLV